MGSRRASGSSRGRGGTRGSGVAKKTKGNQAIRLVERRKAVIMEFKKVATDEDAFGKIGDDLWKSFLMDYMNNYRTENEIITMDDIERWIKSHRWITHQSQETEETRSNSGVPGHDLQSPNPTPPPQLTPQRIASSSPVQGSEDLNGPVGSGMASTTPVLPTTADHVNDGSSPPPNLGGESAFQPSGPPEPQYPHPHQQYGPFEFYGPQDGDIPGNPNLAHYPGAQFPMDCQLPPQPQMVIDPDFLRQKRYQAISDLIWALSKSIECEPELRPLLLPLDTIARGFTRNQHRFLVPDHSEVFNRFVAADAEERSRVKAEQLLHNHGEGSARTTMTQPDYHQQVSLDDDIANDNVINVSGPEDTENSILETRNGDDMMIR